MGTRELLQEISFHRVHWFLVLGVGRANRLCHLTVHRLWAQDAVTIPRRGNHEVGFLLGVMAGKPAYPQELLGRSINTIGQFIQIRRGDEETTVARITYELEESAASAAREAQLQQEYNTAAAQLAAELSASASQQIQYMEHEQWMHAETRIRTPPERALDKELLEEPQVCPTTPPVVQSTIPSEFLPPPRSRPFTEPRARAEEGRMDASRVAPGQPLKFYLSYLCAYYTATTSATLFGNKRCRHSCSIYSGQSLGISSREIADASRNGFPFLSDKRWRKWCFYSSYATSSDESSWTCFSAKCSFDIRLPC